MEQSDELEETVLSQLFASRLAGSPVSLTLGEGEGVSSSLEESRSKPFELVWEGLLGGESKLLESLTEVRGGGTGWTTLGGGRYPYPIGTKPGYGTMCRGDAGGLCPPLGKP